MITNCIIIDDEPYAQALLEKHIEQIKNLTLIGKFENPILALDIIQNQQVDIIFLDISMPGMTGIDFLKSFADFRPHIIITTAYPEYAVEGFDFNVVDYIVKPISFERFVKAINKVKEKMLISKLWEERKPDKQNSKTVELINQNFIWIKVDKTQTKILYSEIIYIEGMGDYLKIHTPNKVFIAHITMSTIIEMLDSPDFVRVHKSYIIRLGAVKSYKNNLITTSDGKEINIGVSYRAKVKEILNQSY